MRGLSCAERPDTSRLRRREALQNGDVTMQVRLILLLVVLVGLGVGVAIKFTGAKKVGANETSTEDLGTTLDSNGESLELVREKQKPLGLRELPGEEPSEPPQLSIRAYPDKSSGKNRIMFEITEARGYYVESFDVVLWYKSTPDMTLKDSPLPLPKVVENFVKANETLVDCMEVVPTELSRVKGDLGTEENWGAMIQRHGRARAKNPEPLPPLAEAYDCGT